MIDCWSLEVSLFEILRLSDEECLADVTSEKNKVKVVLSL